MFSIKLSDYRECCRSLGRIKKRVSFFSLFLFTQSSLFLYLLELLSLWITDLYYLFSHPFFTYLYDLSSSIPGEIIFTSSSFKKKKANFSLCLSPISTSSSCPLLQLLIYVSVGFPFVPTASFLLVCLLDLSCLSPAVKKQMIVILCREVRVEGEGNRHVKNWGIGRGVNTEEELDEKARRERKGLRGRRWKKGRVEKRERIREEVTTTK